VAGQPAAGLATLNVKITYDGYDSSSRLDRNQYATWEIPVQISGNPLFDITPLETTYFEGALEELELQGMAMSSVKELQATLSSDCLTVIGSSKRHVGSISADEPFSILYEIKPASSGACETTLSLSYRDEVGTSASEDIDIGLNIEDAGVDFKVVKVDYGTAGPGETAVIKVALKNEGQVTSEDTTLSLTLDDPFVPVDGIEKFVGDVGPGETVQVEFFIYVSWDATTQTYALPLNIDYKIGGGSYSEEKGLGIDVSGEVVLKIISIDSTSGSVRVQVANIGTRNADSLTATLVTSGQAAAGGRQLPGGAPQNRTSAFARQGSQLVEYKSSIKATKESTFTFSTSYSGSATLILEYTGVNNKRVQQVEEITIGSGASAVSAGGTSGVSGGFGARARGGGSIFDTLLYVAIAAVLGYLGYRYYKKRKEGELESKGWKNLFGFI